TFVRPRYFSPGRQSDRTNGHPRRASAERRNRRRSEALLPSSMRLLALELLHRLQRLGDVVRRAHAADGRGDLPVLLDDDGGALGDPVADFVALGVLRAGLSVGDLEVVALRDLPVGVGGDGDLAGAELRVGGELVEGVDLVERDADDARAGGGEVAALLREVVGLPVAAAGERGRVEVDDDRSLLERVLQVERELLAGERGGRLELGRLVALLERRESRGREEEDRSDGTCHGVSPAKRLRTLPSDGYGVKESQRPPATSMKVPVVYDDSSESSQRMAR